jgi:pilus assembly protein Flp/PilA
MLPVPPEGAPDCPDALCTGHPHESGDGRPEESRAMVEFVNALVGLYLPEEREGQGLVEYALIIVLVAIAVIALLTLLGGQVGNVFSKITSSLN